MELILQKRTRSILDELANISSVKDPANLVESRADHLIQSAINLTKYIREHYSAEHADELERRLLNSIRTHDTEKFRRGIRKIANENK